VELISLSRISIPGEQHAGHRSQSQSDAEGDADCAERMVFDLIFGVVDHIFRCAAAPLDGAARCLDPVFDCVRNSLFHSANSCFQLNSSGADIRYGIEQFAFHGHSFFACQIAAASLTSCQAWRSFSTRAL
jgi:hypothetical protein